MSRPFIPSCPDDLMPLPRVEARESEMVKTLALDAESSKVTFAVRHLWRRIKGEIKLLSGEVLLEKGRPVSLRAKLDATSLSTGHAKRDKDLHSKSFLNAEHYPEILFESTGLEPNGDGGYSVVGLLTLRGVSQPVRFEMSLTGLTSQAQGVLKRFAWGILPYPPSLVLIGKEVHFSIATKALSEPF
jgi:polyisoprenoid-binding protein YceI